MEKIIIFNSGSQLYGSERGLINLVKTLKDNYQVIVVLPKRGPLSEVLSGYNVLVKFFPLAVLSFSFSPAYYLKYIFLSILNLFYFSFYVKFKSVDLVYSNNLLLLFPGFVARLTQKNHVWHIREFFHKEKINRILSFVVRHFSQQIICQSKNIKNVLFNDLTERVKVIYESIEIKDYESHVSFNDRLIGFQKDKKVFSIIGRIHPLKGQYEFLRLMACLEKKVQERIVLLIAGGYSSGFLRDFLYKNKIRKIIKRNELEDRVVFLGFLKNIKEVFENSDVCVFPTRRNEPFGLSLLEAFIFSKKVLYEPNPGSLEVASFFKGKGEYLSMGTFQKSIEEKQSNSKEPRVPEVFTFKNYKDNILDTLRDLI